jgi:hypothetical protein
MKQIITATLLRFLRTFISAGIAQTAVVVIAHPLMNLDLANIKTWIAVLISSFVAGGIMGIDKAIRFQDNPIIPEVTPIGEPQSQQ